LLCASYPNAFDAVRQLSYQAAQSDPADSNLEESVKASLGPTQAQTGGGPNVADLQGRRGGLSKAIIENLPSVGCPNAPICVNSNDVAEELF